MRAHNTLSSVPTPAINNDRSLEDRCNGLYHRNEQTKSTQNHSDCLQKSAYAVDLRRSCLHDEKVEISDFAINKRTSMHRSVMGVAIMNGFMNTIL